MVVLSLRHLPFKRPHFRLTQDEEAVISAQVARVCPEAEARVELFVMSRMVEVGAGDHFCVFSTNSCINTCQMTGRGSALS